MKQSRLGDKPKTSTRYAIRLARKAKSAIKWSVK